MQEAELEIHSFFGFETTVEKIAIKQYLAHIQKGKDIMHFFIDQVLEESKAEDFTPYEESKCSVDRAVVTAISPDIYRTQRSEGGVS